MCIRDRLYDGNAVRGVKVRRHGETYDVPAAAVVLASGGFEANREWRTRYLGPGWDLAKVDVYKRQPPRGVQGSTESA